jgi:transposase
VKVARTVPKGPRRSNAPGLPDRDVRPVKIQQRTSGGCWRTLEGLTDFAIVQSYLSTASKWGLDTLDALTRLFTTGPWLPPAAQPL